MKNFLVILLIICLFNYLNCQRRSDETGGIGCMACTIAVKQITGKLLKNEATMEEICSKMIVNKQTCYDSINELKKLIDGKSKEELKGIPDMVCRLAT